MKQKTYRKWTWDEVDYLRENFPDKTAIEIAAILGRTRASVWGKAEGLEIRKTPGVVALRNETGPWKCPQCNQTKPTDEFGSYSEKGTIKCLKCTAANQRSRRRRLGKGAN